VRVGGEHDGALVVAVTARAVDGRATEAALHALADSLTVRRRDLRLVSGATSRTKVVELSAGAGDPAPILAMIAKLRGEP
jgi:uncharacterized protein YggU (UPF0235/DUF167 family)